MGEDIFAAIEAMEPRDACIAALRETILNLEGVVESGERALRQARQRLEVLESDSSGSAS